MCASVCANQMEDFPSNFVAFSVSCKSSVLVRHRMKSMNLINIGAAGADEHTPYTKIQWLKVFVCLQVIELLIELIKFKVRIDKF